MDLVIVRVERFLMVCWIKDDVLELNVLVVAVVLDFGLEMSSDLFWFIIGLYVFLMNYFY